MGAAGFSVYQAGTHLGQAFKEARVLAEAEDGGRRGNVAAKDEVVPLVKEPVTLAAAYELASQYSERNTQDVDDKGGPAGAIAVRGQERQVEVTITETAGGYATTEEAAKASLQAQGLLREGESMAYGVQGMYSRNARGRIVSGTLYVPVTGAATPEQTGWLFFGVAAD